MFQDKLRGFLKNKFPDARDASGNKEIAMRCRFCGDSQGNKSARHLYISLGTDQAPPMFKCFKCNESGILSAKILQGLVDCSDNGEFLAEFRNNNMKVIKTSKNVMKNRQAYRIFNTFVSNSDISNAKLHYINKRLGLQLTFNDILENKIVLNLKDLLASNRVDKFTRYPNIIDELNDCFIGFLSMDNGFINMKNLVYKKQELSKSINLRYVNYSIFDNQDNARRYYTIPTKSNIASMEPIHIHIAEGPFDILSIFYNLRGANRVQNIYSSIGGKSYLNLVKLYIKEMGLMNVVFHIYVDNDISDDEIKHIADLLRPLGIVVYLHRNMYPGEKDFGVSKDKIKEQIIKI